MYNVAPCTDRSGAGEVPTWAEVGQHMPPSVAAADGALSRLLPAVTPAHSYTHTHTHTHTPRPYMYSIYILHVMMYVHAHVQCHVHVYTGVW